jgi:hypothetical protein
MSLDLLEDSEDLESHIHISPRTQSQASPDLLEALKLTDVGDSQVPELPEHPQLSQLTDLPEVSRNVAGSQLTEADGLSHHLLEECGPNTGRPRNRISFMNRCVRATKLFFLLSSKGSLYDEIDNQVYLNGKIIAVPRKGITVCEILWGTSSLPHLVLDES